MESITKNTAVIRFVISQSTNDPEGFAMPYKLYGVTDLETMKHRYQKLLHNSYGCIVRLNHDGQIK